MLVNFLRSFFTNIANYNTKHLKNIEKSQKSYFTCPKQLKNDLDVYETKESSS